MFMVFTVDPMMFFRIPMVGYVSQQFESNVIYPRVVGSSVGLPGIYVMMTVVVFVFWQVYLNVLRIPTAASIYKPS